MAEGVVRSVAAFLALVLACAALLAATAALTGERIADNRARRLLDMVSELTGRPVARAELQWSGDVAPLCEGDGRTALVRGKAPGYGGTIHWLAAVTLEPAPRVTGLRITAHQETPGIADFLGRPGEGWMARLVGADAEAMAAVDTVSGATITSRALLNSLTSALSNPRLETLECPS